MRFFKPSTTEYQSQFSPLNLDFMQKNLVQKEANDDAVDDLLDKTSQLRVKGGNYTTTEEEQKYNNWLKKNTDNVRNGLLNNTMDYKEASKNLTKIIEVYNTNDTIKRINNDAVYSKFQNKNLVEGKLNRAVGTNFNYLGQTPTWNKVNMSEITDDQHAALYNTIAPTGIYDKENYQHQMDKFVGDAVSNQFDLAPKKYDTLTGVPMVEIGDHKYTREELKEEKVREWARNVWEQENRNSNTPFMQYQKQLYGLSGGEYTQQQFIEDAANGFPGYYKREITQDNKSYQQLPKEETKKVEATPLANRALTKGAQVNVAGIKNIDSFKKQMNETLKGITVREVPNALGNTSQGYTGGPREEGISLADWDDKKLDLLEKYYRAINQDAVVDNIIAPARKGGKDYLKAITPKLMQKALDKMEGGKSITSLEKAFKEMVESGYVDANAAVTDFNTEGVTSIIDPSILGIQGKADKNITLEDISASFLSQNISIIDGSTMKELTKGNSSAEFFKSLGYTLGTDKLADVPASIYSVDPDNSLRVASADKTSWGNAVKITVLAKDGTFKNFFIKDLKQTSKNPDPNIREQENTQIAFKENVNNLINDIHSLQFEPNGEKVYLDPNDPSKYVYAIREKDKQGRFKAYWYHSDNPNRKYTNSEAVTRYSLKLDVDKGDYLDKPAAGKK